MLSALVAVAGLLAGTVVGLVFAIREQRARATAAAEHARANALARLYEIQGEELKATRATMVDSVARREEVIAFLKGEIAKLEADLDGCQAPGVVRDRLRRMLSRSDHPRGPNPTIPPGGLSGRGGTPSGAPGAGPRGPGGAP